MLSIGCFVLRVPVFITFYNAPASICFVKEPAIITCVPIHLKLSVASYAVSSVAILAKTSNLGLGAGSLVAAGEPARGFCFQV